MDDLKLQRGSATTVVLVLAVLKDGPRHGYDIAREVERRSGDTLSFKYATLYSVLHGLEADGFIISVWEQPQEERRARRVYDLTAEGLIALEKACKQWVEFSQAVNSVIDAVGLLPAPKPGVLPT
ncbi:MAG: helix-turn-helix transcriptional regulator [Fibrella sp.]|nr:helix-turn-helix transcriptional regulator [Armatimonadota bacterium]